MNGLTIVGDVGKEGAKCLCSYFVSIAKWHRVFQKSGEAITESPRYVDSPCLPNIKAILSKQNLNAAAKESHKVPASRFVMCLDTYWTRTIRPEEKELTRNGISPDCLKEDIIETIKVKIESANPELATQLELHELNLGQKQINRQLTELANLFLKNDNSTKREIRRYFHIKDLNLYLEKRSSKKKIDLQFFNFHDTRFEKELETHVSQKTIFVCGRYHEETAFAVCEALGRLKPDADIYFCFDEQSWNEFRPLRNNKDTYVVNGFVAANTLRPIEGCHSVFICGFQEKKQDCVLLRHRTWRSTEDALKNAGFERPWEMVKSTNNEYPPLSRKLFRDYSPIQHSEWKKHYGIRLLTAMLLVGEWSAATDWDFICNLSGESRETIEERIRVDQQNPDPFIKEKAGFFRSIHYSIVSSDEAWSALGTSITAPMVDRFFAQARSVLFQQKEGRQSVTLQKAVLSTFSYLQIYSDVPFVSAPIRAIVEALISEMRQKDCNEIIENLLPLATEAAPDIFFQAIKDDIAASQTSKTLQGFMKYFAEDNKSYPGILWAYDLLLANADSAYDSAMVLADWIHLIKGKLYWDGNSPLHSLTTILLAWIKSTPITAKQKKAIFDRAICVVDNESIKLMKSLQYHGHATASALYEPRIRAAFYEWQGTTRQETFDLYGYYCDRYMASCLDNNGRLVAFIENEAFYAFVPVSLFCERILEASATIGDSQKEKLFRALKKYVYKNRYFADSDWAASEEYVEALEVFADAFAFEKPEYGYLYLFACSDYDIPISHPTPFQNQVPDNSEKQARTIAEAVDSFVSKQCDRGRLNALIAGESEVNRFYPQFLFACGEKQGITNPVTIFREAVRDLKKSKKAIWRVLEYVKQAFPAASEDIARACSESEDPFVSSEYLSSLVYDLESPSFVALFAVFSQSQKDTFWKESRFVPEFTPSAKNLRFVAEALIQNDNSGLLVDLIYQAVETGLNISPDEIVGLLEQVKLSEIRDGRTSTYAFKKIMDRLRSAFGFTEDLALIERLAALELKLDPQFSDNTPYFLRRAFKYSPATFVDVIGRFPDPTYFHIYRSANFCPGEENGIVSIPEFTSWVERFRKELDERGLDSYWGNKAIADICTWSPLGPDGIKPAPELREFLDKAGEEVLDEFAISILNQHGFHTVTDGQEYYDLEERFRKQAKQLEEYPHLAKTYRRIAENYRNYAEEERRSAEDE